MVINENLSQINTFTGGMNTDISDALLKPDQYRYAENIRINGTDSNSGEVSLIEGVKKLNIDTSTINGGERFNILAIDSIDNTVCLITSRNVSDYGEPDSSTTGIRFAQAIYVHNSLNAQDTVEYNGTTYKSVLGSDLNTYFHGTSQLNTEHFGVKGFDQYHCQVIQNYTQQNELGIDSQSQYIVYDSYNDMVEGLSAIVESGGLLGTFYIKIANSQQNLYLSRQGIITYYTAYIKPAITRKEWAVFTNNNYGNGDYSLTFGWCSDYIFNNATEPVGINTMMRFISANNLKLYITGPNNDSQIISINVKAGYAGDKISDVTQSVQDAIGSLEVNLFNAEESGIRGAKVYYCYKLYNKTGQYTSLSPLSQQFTLYGDHSGLEEDATYGTIQSTYHANITLQNKYFSGYDKIELYRVSYYSQTDLPKVDVIVTNYDLPSNEDFNYTDTGQNSSDASITPEILISQISSTTKFPRLLETKDNYLFIGGISDDRDNSDKLFESIDTTCKTSGNLNNLYDHLQFRSENLHNYNPEYWKNSENAIGGDGEYISWVQANPVYSGLDLIDDNVCSFESLIPGEQYRFAIVFYTKSGARTSPKWICDIMLGEGQYVANYTSEAIQHSYSWCVKNVHYNTNGIGRVLFTVDVDKIKQVVPDFAGYEIVIADRTEQDILCLSRGLISNGSFNGSIVPNGRDWELINNTTNNLHVILQGTDCIKFYSPEVSFSSKWFDEFVKDNISKLSIKPVYIVDDELYKTGEVYNNGDFYKYASKLIDFKSTTPRGTTNGYWDFVSSYSDNDFRDSCAGTNIVVEKSSYNHLNKDEGAIYSQVYVATRLFDNIETSPVKVLAGNLANFPTFDTKIDSNGSAWRDPITGYNPLSSLLTDDDHKEELNPNSEDALSCPAWVDGLCYSFKINKIEPNYDDYTRATKLRSSSTVTIGGENRPGVYSSVIADIIIANIPYNGHNKQSIQNTTYHSIGLYKPYDTEDVLRGKVYVSGDGGSCWGMFSFIFNRQFQSDTYDLAWGQTTCLCAIPVYSRIDLSGDSGYNPLRKNLPIQGLQQDVVSGNVTYRYAGGETSIQQPFSQGSPFNHYVTGYSSKPTIFTFQPVDLEGKEYSNSENRVYYSGKGYGDEEFDNWLDFPESQYIPIDTKYGRITALKQFKSRLYFWQEQAFGWIEVNERAITQAEDGTNIILGKSGMLSRYDYISTQYGLKLNQICIQASDRAIYWWDERNREILMFNGESVVPLSTAKNIKTYVQNGILNVNPTVTVDIKKNEILFGVVNGESVVYNENIGCFTSIYKIFPQCSTNNIKRMIVTKNDEICEYGTNNDGSVSFENISIYPKLKYVVNKNPYLNKTFDNTHFGGTFYVDSYGMQHVNNLRFKFNSNLNQQSELKANQITDREGFFTFSIPRNGTTYSGNGVEYGNRMRGKTMTCELTSTDNSTDFSLQYIITKFRMSWI